MSYLALCLWVNFHLCAISLPFPLYLLGYHLEALIATIPPSKMSDNQVFLAEISTIWAWSSLLEENLSY